MREETISAIKRPINLLLEKVKEKEKRHPKPGSERESMAAGEIVFTKLNF